MLVLLDQLGLDRVTILGTSRGGLVAMVLAATAKDRLSGVILNDVGPEIMTEGLSAIMTYIGKPPVYRTMAEAAEALPALYGDSFGGVSADTWAVFTRRLFREEGGRLHLRYDPRLREAVAPAFAPDAVAPDLWPLFDALEGLPLGLIRGGEFEPPVGRDRRRDAAPPPRHGVRRGAPARACPVPGRTRGAGRHQRHSGQGFMSTIDLIEAAAARAEGVVRRTPPSVLRRFSTKSRGGRST